MNRYDENYSVYFGTPSAEYPEGSAVDSTDEDKLDGTPLLAKFMNDVIGFMYAVFHGVYGNPKIPGETVTRAISNEPDNATQSDVWDAIKKFVVDKIEALAKVAKTGKYKDLTEKLDVNVTGNGNAVTTAELSSDGVTLNLMKGATFLTTLNVQAGEHINEVGTPSVDVSVSGTTTTLTFNYLKGTQGDKGDKGPTGATGPQGPQGPQGPAGPLRPGFDKLVYFTTYQELWNLTCGANYPKIESGSNKVLLPLIGFTHSNDSGNITYGCVFRYNDNTIKYTANNSDVSTLTEANFPSQFQAGGLLLVN